MSYSDIYPENQFLRVLDDAYNAREQKGVLTAAVTTKFQNDASQKGVQKLQTALASTVHADHAAAVTALNELLS